MFYFNKNKIYTNNCNGNKENFKKVWYSMSTNENFCAFQDGRREGKKRFEKMEEKRAMGDEEKQIYRPDKMEDHHRSDGWNGRCGTVSAGRDSDVRQQ